MMEQVARTYNGGGFNLVCDGSGTLHATVSRPESWKVHFAFAAISKSTYTYTFSLEIFECSRNIEEALAAAGDDCHWCSAQLGKVCRDIHAGLGTSMNAAKSTCTKDLDTS